MLTQLPFHKDKDFQQLNFFMLMFMLMFIVSIVYIAGCVEYLDYQRQSEVSSVIRTVTPMKASRKKLSLVFKDANLSIIFFFSNTSS